MGIATPTESPFFSALPCCTICVINPWHIAYQLPTNCRPLNYTQGYHASPQCSPFLPLPTIFAEKTTLPLFKTNVPKPPERRCRFPNNFHLPVEIHPNQHFCFYHQIVVGAVQRSLVHPTSRGTVTKCWPFQSHRISKNFVAHLYRITTTAPSTCSDIFVPQVMVN